MPRDKAKRISLWLTLLVSAVFAVLIFKIVLIVTAKTKATVDYVAQFNKLTKPENYDPNQNAAGIYQKAFAAYRSEPNEILWKTHLWSGDLNDVELNLLGKWLSDNEQSLEYLRQAASKPYLWIELSSEGGVTSDYAYMEQLGHIREVTCALAHNAKFLAWNGNWENAFDELLKINQVAAHSLRPKSTMSQLTGMGCQYRMVDDALLLLSHLPWEYFSQAEQFNSRLVYNDLPHPFFIEQLWLYRDIDMAFAFTGDGSGRLAFCKVRNDPKHWWVSFFGPTKQQTIEDIQKIISLFVESQDFTPWQLEQMSKDPIGDIDEIWNNNALLRLSGSNVSKSLHGSYYLTRAKRNALRTVLAVLRFDNYYSMWPGSLQEVVDFKLLDEVPSDPFSDGALVYHADVNGFTLYSVGEDFKDDGGDRSEDIVYWPVK